MNTGTPSGPRRVRGRRSRTDLAEKRARRHASAGFSMVELLVAVMILSVGLLALAGGMGVVVGSVTRSEVVTDRTAALQSGLEIIRSMDFEDVDAGTEEMGAYEVRWEVVGEDSNWKDVEVTVDGPGPSVSGGIPGASQGTETTYTYTVVAQ